MRGLALAMILLGPGACDGPGAKKKTAPLPPPPPPTTAQPKVPFDANTDWFKDARYGLFVHFIPGMNDITATSSADWNSKVNAFDVNAFADQVVATGAKYVVMTLGQDSGYYCSPNAAYDWYVGAGKTSTRDLPAEVLAALGDRGIKLMLYVGADAPSDDPAIALALGVTTISSDGFDYVLTPTLRTRWSQVIREWSDRYGSGVAGWLFDGAYAQVGFDASYASAFAAAARDGNPSSIVGFDPAPDADVQTYPQFDPEDFTAGEMNLVDPATYQYPLSRWTDHATQWHALSFLGPTWGNPSSTPVDGEIRDPLDGLVVKNYINDVNARGGVVTFDMAVFKNGSLAANQLDLMAGVKQSLRVSRTVPHIDRSVTATSEQSGYEGQRAIDNDLGTMWQTRFDPIVDPLPQSITYALGGTYPITAFRYLPRRDQSVSMNGNITGYNLYGSLDGVTFTLLSSGVWADDGAEKTIELSAVPTAFVKLEVTAGHGGSASAANINVEYESPPGAP